MTKSELIGAIVAVVRVSRAHKSRVEPLKNMETEIVSWINEFEQSVIEKNKITEIISTKTTVES